METWQKQHIEKNLVRLIKNTVCTAQLLKDLRSRSIFIGSSDEEILDHPHLSQLVKSRKLYEILQSRVDLYEILIRFLKDTQQSVALKILKKDEPDIRSHGAIEYDKNTLLGTGSLGTKVYRGSISGKNVAVKVLPCDHVEPKRALAEIKAFTMLEEHENIVRYFFAEKVDDQLYIALELCTITLEDEIKIKLIGMAESEILKKSATGLAHLHRLKIIHKGIKPTNILLSYPNQVKLSDFGLSRLFPLGASNGTITTSVLGPADWIAPEILSVVMREEVLVEPIKMDMPSDIFSFGCVIFFTLTSGLHPFGSAIEKQYHILMNKPKLEPLQDICTHESLIQLVTAMLAHNAKLRPTADEVVSSLISGREADTMLSKSKQHNKDTCREAADESVRFYEEAMGEILFSADFVSDKVIWREHEKIVADALRANDEFHKLGSTPTTLSCRNELQKLLEMKFSAIKQKNEQVRELAYMNAKKVLSNCLGKYEAVMKNGIGKVRKERIKCLHDRAAAEAMQIFKENFSWKSGLSVEFQDDLKRDIQDTFERLIWLQNLKEEIPSFRKCGAITYNKNALIGKGAYGTKVYSGKLDEGDVAVQVIPCDELEPACALAEFELHARSHDHENIVRYFCAENYDDHLHIVLELWDITLQDEAKMKIINLKPSEISKKCANGLAYLHKNRIIHRDIKPANILLSFPNKVKLSDFATCKHIPWRALGVKIIGVDGTPDWMAPELLALVGKEDACKDKNTTSCDIFSLGCVIFFALTNGLHPFGSALKRAINILDDKPHLEPVRNQENWLLLITSMLAHNAKLRPTADEVLRSIELGGFSDFISSESKQSWEETCREAADDECLRYYEEKVAKFLASPGFLDDESLEKEHEKILTDVLQIFDKFEIGASPGKTHCPQRKQELKLSLQAKFSAFKEKYDKRESAFKFPENFMAKCRHKNKQLRNDGMDHLRNETRFGNMMRTRSELNDPRKMKELEESVEFKVYLQLCHAHYHDEMRKHFEENWFIPLHQLEGYHQKAIYVVIDRCARLIPLRFFKKLNLEQELGFLYLKYVSENAKKLCSEENVQQKDENFIGEIKETVKGKNLQVGIDARGTNQLQILPLMSNCAAKDYTDEHSVYVGDVTKEVGEFNSQVHYGFFKGAEVYIKKIPGVFQDSKMVFEDITSLLKLEEHENVLKHFQATFEGHELLLITDVWQTSLKCCVEEKSLPRPGWSAEEVIRQAAHGIKYLHEKNFVHGNVNPSSILIEDSKHLVKVADFGMPSVYSHLRQKSLESGVSVGVMDWLAPEVLENFRNQDHTKIQVPDGDIFSLGCVFYYILSNGKHPFGDILKRFHNMIQNQPMLKETFISPQYNTALVLVSSMISRENTERPSSTEILCHPTFWTTEQTVSFVKRILELLLSENNDAKYLVKQVEKSIGQKQLSEWTQQVDENVFGYLTKQMQSGVNTNAVKYFLSCCLYVVEHFHDFPDDLKAILGNSPNNGLVYMMSHFPFCIILLWYIFYKLKESHKLQQFYGGYKTIKLPKFLLEKFPELAAVLEPDKEKSQ